MNTARVSGPGEPNKLCDLLAAGISEEYQKRDADAATDIVVSGGNGALFVAGKVKSAADFDVATLVKQMLGSIDPGLSLEPFIAIEAAPEIKPVPLLTTGYASAETPTGLPRANDLAIGIARMIEDARKGNEGWFWLSPDYDVTIHEAKSGTKALIRVSHIDSVSVEDVRGQINELLDGRIHELRVNPAGPDSGNGLSKGLGASGRSNWEWFGHGIPTSLNASGSELAHPANIGWMMARCLAKQLVSRGLGKAVMVDLFWEPLEDLPTFTRARNERGIDLSEHIDKARLSRAALAKKWNTQRLVTGKLHFSFDGATDLPFENEDLLQ